MVMHKLVSDGKRKKYRDLELNQIFEVGAERDVTLKRVKQINDNLADYGIRWERMDEEGEEEGE